MLIKKEYNVENLVNELSAKIDYAEEYEKYFVKIPITEARDILDILNELSALPAEKCVISSNYKIKQSKPEYRL